MKDFVHWLFSQNNSDLQIGLFDVWHFLYLFITFGGSTALALALKNRSEQAKQRAIRLFAYLTIGLYVADFFIMPLSDSYSGISVYKLPFNICTIMAAMVPFAQFNAKFAPIKSVIVTLSITSSVMCMCYPGTALGGQPPFSYVIFQTFMYHAFLYTWGFLNLAFGSVTLNFKNIWKELIAILIILVWAAFGNTVYDGEQNWFFIQKSIFPFLSDEIMPFMVVFCVFGSCFIVYCAYYGIRALINKYNNKKITVA
ncbi:MAG: YwaF family protein [Clostridia bacterium]|nr:YwaF family protein [Clostridia bacterium]